MAHKILVVDDDSHIRFIFQSFLTGADYQVVTAESYEAAIPILDEGGLDLLLTDIHMGSKGGLDLLHEVQRRGPGGPYVLLVTGYPNLESVQEALRAGAHDYLVKPVLKENLIRQVKSALAHKAMRDERERIQRRLTAVFNSVRDAIITVDANLRIMEFNQSAERICGFTAQDTGQPLHNEPRHCLGHCREALDRVFKNKNRVEMVRLQCDSSIRAGQMVDVSASPLFDETGQFLGAVMVVRDETRLAALEKNLGERQGFHGIIGRSRKMQEIYALIENLADVDTTVLVTGESGTGKERIADALHGRGVRNRGTLVKVNCSGLSETLLESELFGHVRGAFTGAVKDKVGRFQLADKGTIFLDEIGDVSSRMQTRLLRVLQNKELERVGESRTVQVDVRVVAATNQNLREKIAQGLFREDLYYRLKVVEIHLPALRDRREDIPLLVDHFTKRFNGTFGKSITGVSKNFLKVVMEYPWPGNIRELEHAIEHAFVVCRDGLLDVKDLPPEMTNRQPRGGFADPALAQHRGFLLENPDGEPEEGEREQIIRALEKSGWVKSRAARGLGMSRSTLYRKMQELKINDPTGTHS
ncbi:MAG: sigma 54-interacting transcriptional regulator [Magnetococcales bacterium]|nr:sigma 54-interacting transcriptional regulator [Magnetococcales bacterium]